MALTYCFHPQGWTLLPYVTEWNILWFSDITCFPLIIFISRILWCTYVIFNKLWLYLIFCYITDLVSYTLRLRKAGFSSGSYICRYICLVSGDFISSQVGHLTFLAVAVLGCFPRITYFFAPLKLLPNFCNSKTWPGWRITASCCSNWRTFLSFSASWNKMFTQLLIIWCLYAAGCWL